MEVYLKEISEQEFNILKMPVLFDNKNTSRMYGILTNNEQSFGLTWQSTISKPVLTEISSNIFGIGIDQNFAIVDFTHERVLLNLNLSYYFYTTEIFGKNIFIITQLEILRLDNVTYKVLEEIPLPEFFESIKPKENGFEVTCMGDVIVEII